MIFKRAADLESYLKKPDPLIRAAVVFGADRAKVHEIGSRIAGIATQDPSDPFNVSILSESQIESGAGLESELSAQSMTGGRRLVWLRLLGEKPSSAGIVTAALQAHLDGQLNPDCYFLVESAPLEASSALRKAAEKASHAFAMPCYEDDQGDLTRLIRDQLAQDRVGLTADALRVFLARLPPDRGIVRQEIERLALWIGPGQQKPIDSPELEQFLGPEPTGSFATAAISAFGGRLGETLSNLSTGFSAGEGGVAALRALAGHLTRLRRLLLSLEQGKSEPEAIKANRIFWKQEKEFLRQIRAWKDQALVQVQADLYQADLECRSTGSPDRMIAERLALGIAARARRLKL